MRAEYRAAGWLAAIVVLAVAGSAMASALAANQTFYDAYTHTPYSIAFHLPIHVVQAASPGWNVLLFIWVMLAAIAICGDRLVRALRQALRARGLLRAGVLTAAAAAASATATRPRCGAWSPNRSPAAAFATA